MRPFREIEVDIKYYFLVKIPIYLEVRDMKNLSGKQCLDLINDSIKEYNDESNDATYSIKTSPKDAEVIVLGVDKCLTDYKKPYVKGLEKRLNLLEAIKKHHSIQLDRVLSENIGYKVLASSYSIIPPASKPDKKKLVQIIAARQKIAEPKKQIAAPKERAEQLYAWAMRSEIEGWRSATL
jgi:hypothetical protein